MPERTAVGPVEKHDAGGRSPERVAPRQSQSAMVNLQRTVGNQAISRALGSGRPGLLANAVQRHGDFGLRESSLRDPFATKAADYAKNPANGDKTGVEFVDYLASEAGAALETMGCEKPTVTHTNGGYSTFSRTTWAVEVNTLKRAGGPTGKLSSLSEDVVVAFANTIIHEMRHAEQYFKIIQVLAGQGKTKAEILSYTSIPESVVSKGVAKPMVATKDNTEQIATIKSWENITVGSHATYKGVINDMDDFCDEITALTRKVKTSNLDETKTQLTAKIGKLKDDWTPKLTKEKTRLDAISTPSAQDTRIKGVVDDLLAKTKVVVDTWTADSARTVATISALAPAAKALNDATFAAYQSHDHEVDARATGGAAATSFKDKKNAPPTPAPVPK